MPRAHCSSVELKLAGGSAVGQLGRGRMGACPAQRCSWSTSVVALPVPFRAATVTQAENPRSVQAPTKPST